MGDKQISKAEIKKLVNDEVSKVFKDEFNKQLKLSLKNGAGKDEMQEVVKSGLNNLYKFMWANRNIWNNEIKKN